MNTKALLIHSSRELSEVFLAKPALKDEVDIYFLTADVQKGDLEALGISKYQYFDDIFSMDQISQIHTNVSEILETWYLADDGADLTSVGHLSVGRCYSLYLYHIFCHSLKYEGFVRLIEEKYSQIVSTSVKNDLLEKFLKEISPNKIQIVQVKEFANDFIPTPTIAFKSRGMKKFFSFSWSVKDLLRSLFVPLSQLVWRKQEKKRVVFTMAGKSEELVKYYSSRRPALFEFIFPMVSTALSSLRAPFIFINPMHFLYKRSAANLKEKFLERTTECKYIRRPILDFIFEDYLVPSMSGLIGYYKSTQGQLARIQADLVILSAESHETHIAMAQAAHSLGIQTATIAHGLSYPLMPSTFYSGKEKIYDAAFVFSPSFIDKYRSKGFASDSIFVSSFFHFQKFKSLSISPKHQGYKSALILPMDYSDISRTGFVIENLKLTIDCCRKMEFSRIGIKARIKEQLQAMYLQGDHLLYAGLQIPVYSGYMDFPRYAKDYNCVIGPMSSATVEALLLGIDYYCFHPDEAYIGSWEFSPMTDILHVAKNVEELEDNIKNRRIFKSGKTTQDLVVTNFQSDKEYFEFFEKAIEGCLKKDKS